MSEIDTTIEAFDPNGIEVEEYQVGDEQHASVPITVTIISPKTTTVTVTVTASGSSEPSEGNL